MPKYLYEVRYTVEGAKGLARDGGSVRRAAIAKMIEALGGKLEAFYYALGENDLYVIVDAPDNVSAATASLTVNQGGGATVKTVALLSPEEMDAVGQKAVEYRPPGH